MCMCVACMRGVVCGVFARRCRERRFVLCVRVQQRVRIIAIAPLLARASAGAARRSRAWDHISAADAEDARQTSAETGREI